MRRLRASRGAVLSCVLSAARPRCTSQRAPTYGSAGELAVVLRVQINEFAARMRPTAHFGKPLLASFLVAAKIIAHPLALPVRQESTRVFTPAALGKVINHCARIGADINTRGFALARRPHLHRRRRWISMQYRWREKGLAQRIVPHRIASHRLTAATAHHTRRPKPPASTAASPGQRAQKYVLAGTTANDHPTLRPALARARPSSACLYRRRVLTPAPESASHKPCRPACRECAALP